MEVTTPTTATFSLFSALAGELRNQIWHYSVPNADELEPALAFFKPGCWRWRGAQPDLELEFRHDLLDVHIEVPMAFVNREARSIAMPRIRELGLVTKVRSDQYPVFIRTFKPEVDAIYIKPGQLDDMIMDVTGEMYGDWNEGRHWSNVSRFRKIAISETSLISEQGMEDRMGGMEGIAELLNHTCSVWELLVVVGAPADLESAGDHDSKEKPLWRFIPVPGDVFSWSVSRHCFELCGDERVGDGVVSAIVGSEKVNAAFTGIYGSSGYLKVRPVFAIRG